MKYNAGTLSKEPLGFSNKFWWKSCILRDTKIDILNKLGHLDTSEEFLLYKTNFAKRNTLAYSSSQIAGSSFHEIYVFRGRAAFRLT